MDDGLVDPLSRRCYVAISCVLYTTEILCFSNLNEPEESARMQYCESS
jgi:hypothetical protein